VADAGGGVRTEVDTFQAPWELNCLLDLFEILQPSRVLEVGAMWGGTLWHWIRQAVEVVVVDDEMREAELWHDWAEAYDTSLRLVKGRSQDEHVVNAARAFGPYDFAFIDADHSYDSVRADWENYGPLAKVVAFHDILPRPGYGVSQLWGELTGLDGARYVTFCQNEVVPGNEGRCGIGVLWTP
jgi:predicted O-methyltransferase YrrM